MAGRTSVSLTGTSAVGGHEVARHIDLSPKNTVYRSRSPGAETSSVGTGALMLGRRGVESLARRGIMPALIVILCTSLCVYFLDDGCPLRIIAQTGG